MNERLTLTTTPETVQAPANTDREPGAWWRWGPQGLEPPGRHETADEAWGMFPGEALGAWKSATAEPGALHIGGKTMNDWRTIDDMEQDLLASYREFHDGLSDMIEGGRLTEADIPNDYRWLVESLAELASDGDNLRRALEREGG